MKWFWCVLLSASLGAAPSEAPAISGSQVLDHLNRTIGWYQHVSAADQGNAALENLLLADNVQQSAKQVVKKAFSFARAQAASLASSKRTDSAESGAPEQAHTLEQTAAAANERIQNLQRRIDELNQQISKAPRRNLEALTARRETLAADLSLAKVAQSGIKDMLQFASGTEKGSGLLGRINLLAGSGSIPAALNDATPSASGSTSHAGASQQATGHPETAGIAALLADTFQLIRERDQIDSLLDETKKLNQEIVELRAPVRANIRGLLQKSDVVADSANEETDSDTLNSQRQQLERMAAQLKAFLGPILPLSEQGLALNTTEGALSQWRDNTGERLQTVLGYLAFRLSTVAAAVVLLFLISEAVRRATFRYVRDKRRRRQFVLIRRIVVGTLAVFIVVLASVSGIGSFATVAGFVTAGLAVALQNVILSVVAYFFLIGRYGLRTGDRVTVSGVTGQVIEVGLVRLYLMEFAGTGTDLHSTGRVAVFSNSVIFQPSALIKQAPGTEFVWHGVAVTLAPETNLDEARERVAAAVDSVYQTYRKAIEEQHAAFERMANIQLPDAAPSSRARYADSGVEVVARYPVEIEKASRVDEKMINTIMQALNREPSLKLAGAGYPRTLPAT